MGIATGLTAERMLEIEASSVVDGDVVGDNLILTKHDGSTINAGAVRGATGQSASFVLADDLPAANLPSSYPVGISVHSISASAVGWPTPLGIVTTSKINTSRAYQMVMQKITGAVWTRTADTDTWGPWMKTAQADTAGLVTIPRLMITSETDVSATGTLPPFQIGDDPGPNIVMDGNEIVARNNGVGAALYVEHGVTTDLDPASDSMLTRKAYVDKLGVGSEILNATADLNTYTTPGNFTQSSSSRATTGTNYPEALAGLLEVFANGLSAPGMVWQRYTPYGVNVSRFWQRSYYSGYAAGVQWTAWQLVDVYDTGWVNLPISNTTNFSFYGTETGNWIRRIGKQVQFKGAINQKVAGIVDALVENTTNRICVIPAAYLPADIGNSGVWVCQGSSLNRWQLRINSSGAHAGRYGPSASGTSTWLPFNVTWMID